MQDTTKQFFFASSIILHIAAVGLILKLDNISCECRVSVLRSQPFLIDISTARNEVAAR